MAQTNFKNLPKGFAYPVTKKEVREWIKATDINAEVVTFSFAGTGEYYFSKNSTSNTHFVIDVTAVPDESNWHFTIEIRGLKYERYEERREEIAQELLAPVKNWICAKLAASAMTPRKPCRAILSFDLRDKDIVRIEEKVVFHPKGSSPGLFVGF